MTGLHNHKSSDITTKWCVVLVPMGIVSQRDLCCVAVSVHTRNLHSGKIPCKVGFRYIPRGYTLPGSLTRPSGVAPNQLLFQCMRNWAFGYVTNSIM